MAKRKIKTDVKSSPVSIYLVREDRVAGLEETLHAEIRGLSLAAPWDGYLLTMQSTRKPPSWEVLLKSMLEDPQELSLSGESPGALLVVRLSGKTFVLAFGHGRTKLQDEWLEPNFGRRVALNSIEPGKVLELDVEQVFAKFLSASERAPRASSVREFDVEFDRDLVSSVVGVSSREIFGGKIRGATSLRVEVPFPLLRSVLDAAGRHFDSDDYKKRWPEIDNIDPIGDAILIARLEAEFDRHFETGEAQKRVALFTPAYRDEVDRVIDSYILGRRSPKAVRRPYLTIKSWESYLEENELAPTVESAKKTPVHLVSGEEEESRRSNVFACFGYELSLAQKQYVLSSGQWYRVTGRFLGKIHSETQAINSPIVKLPDWNGVESEPEYNARAGEVAGFFSMDAKNIHFGGAQSKFEFCDIVHLASKTLYFVKIPSKSSGMSHLVEQARRTAELFFAPGDSEYRKALARAIKAHHPKVRRDWLDEKPKNGDWNLCLVSLGKKKEDLPFFAQCGLSRLCRELERQGHGVSYLSV